MVSWASLMHPETVTGAHLRKYIGIPFEEENCWQLFRRMYLELFNISLPSFADRYTHCMDFRSNARIFVEESVGWMPVVKGEETTADAVLLHIHGLPSHIGFVTWDGKMIHSEEGALSNRESYRTSRSWANRKKSFYRHPLLA
jgi:cell wall-associated NlpC family hydrolase